jgi:putative ABC transport system permease protein
VVGIPIVLGNNTYRVAGVVALPDAYPGDVDILLPLSFSESELAEGMRGARYLEVVARVAPAATPEEASAALDGFIADLGRRHPLHAGGGGVAVRLLDDLTAPFRGLLAVLLASGVAFLLLAVVNVAGLVTARRVAKVPELSVRRALGASRQRLLGSALLDGTILGCVAGVVAGLGTRWSQPAIVALLPEDLPRLASIDLTPTVAALIVAGGIVSGACVGLLGYVLTPRAVARPGRAPAAGALRTRRALVVAQVAVTTLLAAAGAGVLANALSLRTTDLGFDPEPVTVSVVSPGEERFPSEDALRGFWDGVLTGIEARGLEAAAGTNVPMMGSNMRFGFRSDGSDEQDWAQYHSVTEGYFGVLGIDVLEGRPFRAEDRAPVAIVSRALARAHFRRGEAVGSTIDVVGVERTIVGIVESTRHFGPDREAPLELYVPLWQDPWAFGQVVVRAEPREAGAIVATVAEVAPGLEASTPAALRDHVRRWYLPIVAQLVVVGALALVGMTLAMLGLYAVVAYQVRSRRREMGIRLALGAANASLVRAVLHQGAYMALLGVVLGGVAWWLLRPVMVEWTGVTRIADPVIMTVVAVLVIATCLVATFVPALRSATVDPTVALEADG